MNTLDKSTINFTPVNMESRRKLDIRAGDTVRVWQRIKEGEKTRLQAFEGIIIALKHGLESGSTFTVRRTTGGFGVERIFPLYSPNVEKIELIRRSKVRRAKLYYIREKAAKEIRRKMRQMNAEVKTLLEKEEVKKEPEVAEKEVEKKTKSETEEK